MLLLVTRQPTHTHYLAPCEDGSCAYHVGWYAGFCCSFSLTRFPSALCRFPVSSAFHDAFILVTDPSQSSRQSVYVLYLYIYKGIDCLISQHCYLTVFWTVLSRFEDVSWSKAPIAPPDKLCVLKREKNTASDLADEVSDVSPEQLNK